MSAKFIRRTLRNVVLRNRPYFAHLALTHKCNLRSRFCHIQETQFEELDTAGMQRAIDVLDQIGVGVVSISGGGEPLLRNDFDIIINHAAGKGLYTKITSNGTMPRDRYDRLLASGIREISISLDGVEGNDLPFSHTGPAILRTIQHLHDHLPAGKQLTLNVTVTDANRAQIPHIVAYCAREYPNAKVWLNPVVTGTGKLRSLTQIKVDPAAAEACDSPTLLRAPFYDAGVRDQYQREVYDWGCRAGELFFDVKPNGDVWACQDQPARKPLNVLEPDFARKLRDADFRYRRECSGCTYSCYYITQKGLEPHNWPDMAGLWWKANTRPGDACRQVAERNGWFAGLLSFCTQKLARSMASAALVLLMVSAAAGWAAAPPQDPKEVVARMEQSNEERRQRLEGFECVRTYTAGNDRLQRHAEVTADFTFGAPNVRTISLVFTGRRKMLGEVRRSDPAIPRQRQRRCGASSGVPGDKPMSIPTYL
jgi:MoaA/NifB/PqqE/SkfB family radical SAM enzyme